MRWSLENREKIIECRWRKEKIEVVGEWVWGSNSRKKDRKREE